MRSNYIKREEAIKGVAGKYVGLDESDAETLGQAIGNHSFQELLTDVIALRMTCKSIKWNAGMLEWADVIETAANLFRTDVMEWSVLMTERAWDVTPSDLGPAASDDHNRLMVWAVLQGKTYAEIANY